MAKGIIILSPFIFLVSFRSSRRLIYIGGLTTEPIEESPSFRFWSVLHGLTSEGEVKEEINFVKYPRNTTGITKSSSFRRVYAGIPCRRGCH